jgi:hypothetical protein
MRKVETMDRHSPRPNQDQDKIKDTDTRKTGQDYPRQEKTRHDLIFVPMLLDFGALGASARAKNKTKTKIDWD